MESVLLSPCGTVATRLQLPQGVAFPPFGAHNVGSRRQVTRFILLRLAAVSGVPMPAALSGSDLCRLVSDGAAFRLRSRLVPAGGPLDKVTPATYEGGRYAFERRRMGGSEVPCVILDSVQSQANRMELELLSLRRRLELDLPLITVDFGAAGHPEIDPVTSLDAPHRIFDAILRDSLLAGEPLPKSPLGLRLDEACPADATPLFEHCPTALLFGAWNSTGRRGGGGSKISRSIVSEVVGINAAAGVGTRSRLDPLGILGSVEVYATDDPTGWTIRSASALQDKGKPRLIAARNSGEKSGRPSILNHSSVTPSIEETRGGVTIDYAEQITVISLASLRRLQFPIDGQRDLHRDDLARAVILALGLLSALLLRRANAHLRSSCSLVADAPHSLEFLGGDGRGPERVDLDLDAAILLFRDSLANARSAGLPWARDEIVLTPSSQLIDLVVESRRRWSADGRFGADGSAA